MAIALTLWLDFFNFVAATAARVLFTLFALHIGASASEVGLLGGLLFLFPLLLSWPVGAMADRLGARPLLVFASACGAVSLVLPYFFHTLPALYVAAALNGLAQAFFHVTLQNNIGSLSKPEDRARNFSNFSLVGAITSFVGPLIAGFSIDHWGHAMACVIAALFSLIALALLAVWGGVFPRGKPPVARAAAAKGALLDRGVWHMLILSALIQLGYDLFQFYLPVYGHEIGLSASAIGAVLATLAVAAFVVRLYLPRLIKNVRGETLLGWVFVFGAVSFALVPFSHSALALGGRPFRTNTRFAADRQQSGACGGARNFRCGRIGVRIAGGVLDHCRDHGFGRRAVSHARRRTPSVTLLQNYEPFLSG